MTRHLGCIAQLYLECSAKPCHTHFTPLQVAWVMGLAGRECAAAAVPCSCLQTLWLAPSLFISLFSYVSCVLHIHTNPPSHLYVARLLVQVLVPLCLCICICIRTPDCCATCTPDCMYLDLQLLQLHVDIISCLPAYAHWFLVHHGPAFSSQPVPCVHASCHVRVHASCHVRVTPGFISHALALAPCVNIQGAVFLFPQTGTSAALELCFM